ncbi:hypothetical protein [Treponema sp.]|uniref:hypothetical protein n=1 Tax=Treponema sp. TaxID=166 RepID=UPI0025F0F563|nr:hypothetical protein [Treponema sp.]MCR5218565.1 hypothetical protein [Treponema sp.]
MRKLNYVLGGLLGLAVALAFTACGNDAEAVIGNSYGTSDKGLVIEFRDDNEACYSFLGLPDKSVEYRIKGNEISLAMEGKDYLMKYDKKGDAIEFQTGASMVTLVNIEK